jgi:hypothetical protein
VWCLQNAFDLDGIWSYKEHVFVAMNNKDGGQLTEKKNLAFLHLRVDYFDVIFTYKMLSLFICKSAINSTNILRPFNDKSWADAWKSSKV